MESNKAKEETEHEIENEYENDNYNENNSENCCENSSDTKKWILLIDKGSNSVLKSFALSQREEAFQQFQIFKDYGLDVELKVPSSAETLFLALHGNYQQEHARYLNEIQEELESH